MQKFWLAPSQWQWITDCTISPNTPTKPPPFLWYALHPSCVATNKAQITLHTLYNMHCCVPCFIVVQPTVASCLPQGTISWFQTNLVHLGFITMMPRATSRRSIPSGNSLTLGAWGVSSMQLLSESQDISYPKALRRPLLSRLMWSAQDANWMGGKHASA